MSGILQPTRIDVTANSLFTCDVCGAQERGSTVRLAFKSVDEIATSLHDVPTHHLPVGWACYGSEVAKCPRCIT